MRQQPSPGDHYIIHNQQDIEELNDTVSQPDLADISATPSNCSRKHVLSSIHRPFTKIKHLLSHKELKAYKVCSGPPWWLRWQEFTYSAGDLGSIPGSGRSPGEGNGSPLQYSCLEKPKDRGTWWTTVQGVTKNQTQLKFSNHTGIWLEISNRKHNCNISKHL